MSSRRVLDTRELGEALSGALSLCREDAGEELQGLQVNPRALKPLAEQIQALIRLNNSMDPESFVFPLADVAIAVYLGGLGADGYLPNQSEFPVHLGQWIRTEFAISCAARLARSRRHVIPIQQIPPDEVYAALLNEDKGQLVRIFQHALGIRQYISERTQVARRPVPRAFIATPLTHLDDQSHQMVMQLAWDTSNILTRLGMTVIKPDPNLTPSTVSNGLPDDLARDERLLITGSDLLIAMGAEHDSWGVSRSVSWAEGCCSVVITASTTPGFVSRVLNNTPHRTYRLDTEEDSSVLLQGLKQYLKSVYPIVESHARDRLNMFRRVGPALIEGRKRLHNLDDRTFKRSLLTQARAAELLDHPALLNHASLAEMRELRRLLGTTGDALIDATLGRKINKVGPFRAVTGRGLFPESFANLLSIASAKEWSDVRVVRLIEEYLSPTLPAHLRYRGDTPVSGAEWQRLYVRIFGSGDKA